MQCCKNNGGIDIIIIVVINFGLSAHWSLMVYLVPFGSVLCKVYIITVMKVIVCVIVFRAELAKTLSIS